MILIDNYDSFTYNIAQAFQTLGCRIDVIRNDVLSVGELFARNPSHLIIGPGPGKPSGAGISNALIARATVPILGICLGHQVIAEHFGARVVKASSVMHGKSSEIYHRGESLFQEMPSPFKAARYHSLVVEDLPSCFKVEAWTAHEEIMALRHTSKPLFGVQFHPESVASEEGMNIFRNFLEMKVLFL